MAEQTVAECLTAATDSVTLINDINTNGKKSTYVGGTAEADTTTMTQAEINEMVQRNVDHLELILEYTDPDVKVLVMINHLTQVQLQLVTLI